MRQRIGWLVLLLMCGVVFSTSSAQAQPQSMEIGSETILGLSSTTVDISMTTTAGTEAYVLAIDYDTSLLTATDFVISAAVAGVGAELVQPMIFDATGGATLGVVLDVSPPFMGQEIAAGTNQVIAHLDLSADIAVAALTTTFLEFVDGTHGSPPLSTILVQGGNSLGLDISNGPIVSTNGQITLDVVPMGVNELEIRDFDIFPTNPNGCAEIWLTNSGPVQAFVLAIEHDAALTVVDATVSGLVAGVGAELVEFTAENGLNGGTLGVVLDFVAPFAGQTIPAGVDQHIANFCYTCVHPTAPAPATTHALNFVDGVFGSPLLDNIIVIGSASINPTLFGGTATCHPVQPSTTTYNCGVLENGQIVNPTVAPGDTFELSFFWTDSVNNIGGFQIAACYDCDLSLDAMSFTVAGTILDTVGAEFVQATVGNQPNANGYCEVVAGILLDSLPPFMQQTVPPTNVPLELGRITATVDPNTPCNQCLDFFFCDGATGGGIVPISNIIVVNSTMSLPVTNLFACEVCVEAPRIFIRSDCNGDMLQNIADASTIIVVAFFGFIPPCLDACDSNDDGNVNLADAIYILNFMFQFGPLPPPPFDDNGDFIFDPGPDPTPDAMGIDLGCDNGMSPCP